MGFSLQMFFDELKAILESGVGDNDKVAALKGAIEDAEKYARECGQID